MAGRDNSGWQEWVIAICVTVLSLIAVWTVFGDDVAHLFQPSSQASGQPVSPVANPGQKR